MTTGSTHVMTFEARLDQVKREFNTLIGELGTVEKHLRSIGDTGSSDVAAASARKLTAEYEGLQKQLAQVERELQLIASAEEKLRRQQRQGGALAVTGDEARAVGLARGGPVSKAQGAAALGRIDDIRNQKMREYGLLIGQVEDSLASFGQKLLSTTRDAAQFAGGFNTQLLSIQTQFQNLISDLDSVERHLRAIGNEGGADAAAKQAQKLTSVYEGLQQQLSHIVQEYEQISSVEEKLRRQQRQGGALALTGEEARLAGIERGGPVSATSGAAALERIEDIKIQKAREFADAIGQVETRMASLGQEQRSISEIRNEFTKLIALIIPLEDTLRRQGAIIEANVTQSNIDVLTNRYKKFEEAVEDSATVLQQLLEIQTKLDEFVGRTGAGPGVSLSRDMAAMLDVDPGFISRENAEVASSRAAELRLVIERSIHKLAEEAADQQVIAARNVLDYSAEARVNYAAILAISRGTSPLERQLGLSQGEILNNAGLRNIQQQEKGVFSRQQLLNMGAEHLEPLEKLVFNALSGGGRRFITAFQFAFSGSIIYLAQRLGREFIQQAIQVERAFLDIATALKLNLRDEGIFPGTAEFERSLEHVRQEVLRMADDFNVLPSEANQAAFVMIARFNDVGLALQATRAQLLATKIATINQAETLRALTAVAEGYANSTVTSSTNLTAQERLFRRQTIAAENYSRVLDVATYIQQRFGVQVEDTVEGAARANEVFLQLGFSIEQTSAIVALVSQQLGTTGVTAAEQLGRAFSNLTSPEVRDEILDLAAASNEFNLNIADFESGARAWEQITREVERMRGTQIGDSIQEQIIQIVGRRRETAVLAAALATSEIARVTAQGAGSAAGVAEERFAILRTSLDETIKSIVGQFGELAQNLQELGLLAPLKLFLGSANQAIKAVNELLKLLRNVLSIFDGIRIGGFGFGEMAAVAASLVIAAKGFERILMSFTKVAGLITTMEHSRAVSNVLGLIGFGGGKGAAKVGPVGSERIPDIAFAATGFAAHLNTLANRLRTGDSLIGIMYGRIKDFTTGLIASIAAITLETRTRLYNALVGQFPVLGRVFGLLGRFGKGIKAAVVALGPVVGSLAAIALGLGAFALKVRDAGKQYEEFIKSQKDSVRIAEKEEKGREGSTGASVRFAGQKEFLSRLQNARDSATEGFFTNAYHQAAGLGSIALRHFSDGFASAWDSDVFWDSLGKAIVGSFTLDDQQLAEGMIGLESLSPGSKGSFNRPLQDNLSAIVQAANEALIEDIEKIRGAGPEGAALGSELSQKLFRLRMKFQHATTDQEREDIAESIIALEEQIVLYGSTVEGSISGLLRDIARVYQEQQTGLISIDQAIGEVQTKIDNLRKLAATQENRDPRLYREALQSIFDEEVKLFELEVEKAERLFAIAKLSGNEIDRLTNELRAAENVLQVLIDNERTHGAAYIEALAGVMRARNELASAVLNQNIEKIRTEFQFMQALRTSPEDIIKNLEEYRTQVINELIPLAAQALAGADGEGYDAALRIYEELIRLAFELGKQISDAEKDLKARIASVNTRLAGPIRDPLTQVAADIAAIRVNLEGATGVTRDELLLQLNEALASQAEALAERAAEFTRLSAGVNDAIRRSQSELQIVRHQLQLTAALYGERSAEYARVMLAEDELQFELRNYALQLADLKRRLQTDVTSSFEQAQLDLVQTLQALQQPDMGELERAQLELQRRNQEASAEREFFNDRLFQLEFAFETGALGEQGYVGALRRLLDQVDTTTHQGKEIFLQIQRLIDGMTEDVSDMAFNIPGSIRLPTLFEVRRSLAADQLGVNYQDNRQQNITLEITNEIDLQTTLRFLESAFGDSVTLESSRIATGGSLLTIGGFT